jgi:hypothetical protein
MRITDAEANDFVKYASNPDTWVLAARRNLAVAELLMKRARELQLTANHDFFEFSGCFYAGYFHAGVALENAAKAVRISKDPMIVSKDGLDRKFRKGHALLEPLKSVLGVLTDEEQHFVEKLEEFVWMGRYTVPTTPGPLYDRAKKNNARMSSPKEPELLQSLFDRTIGQLPRTNHAT